MPPAATKSKYGKIVLHFDPTPSQGHGMSVKYEQSINERTVQVWLLYDRHNFKYCTLFVSGTELRTNGQTDRRTDGRTIQTLDAPGRPFRPGHKNATKNFDYTTIADPLKTVSWSNDSHLTGPVKPVYGTQTFPLTPGAVQSKGQIFKNL